MKRRIINVNGSKFTVMIGDSFFLRLRGLIGRKMAKNEGFWLTPCSGVHTWFMSYPIDILYLDEGLQVLRCDRQVPPWRLLRPVKGARQVIELPAGSIFSEVYTIMEVEDYAGI